jgi:hypothetical protein
MRSSRPAKVFPVLEPVENGITSGLEVVRHRYSWVSTHRLW